MLGRKLFAVWQEVDRRFLPHFNKFISGALTGIRRAFTISGQKRLKLNYPHRGGEEIVHGTTFHILAPE